MISYNMLPDVQTLPRLTLQNRWERGKYSNLDVTLQFNEHCINKYKFQHVVIS